MRPVLVGLDASGSAEAWRAAGFTVRAGCVDIGSVRVRIGADGRGICGWALGGIPRTTSVDGLATRVVEALSRPDAVDHPNGASLIDHLVIFSTDDARTIDAFVALGFSVRRVRDDARPGLRQTFLRAGEVILELVARADQEPPPNPEATRFFGIACTVTDLDACAVLLGDALGPVKDAVQPGRRIATLRGRALGLDVPIAFMSPSPS